jgi:hypothetical protein
MPNLVNYVLNRGSVIVKSDSGTKIYAAGSNEYDLAKEFILASDDEGLYNLANGLENAVKSYKGFRVENDVVFVNDEPLPVALGKRLKGFADEGADYNYLLKFWENLKLNPSYKSVNSLFDFLERTHVSIDKNGFIQLFKAVDSELKDKYTHTFDNTPGQVVKMERRMVADDPKLGCSVGLHCGALSYVKEYGNGSTDRFVEVLVNPKHVVSIPEDCNYRKMRVEEYTVVREIPRETVQPTSQTYENPYDVDEDEYDEDFIEDDDLWGDEDEDFDELDEDEDDEDF